MTSLKRGLKRLTDDMLSQDEINALLSGINDEDSSSKDKDEDESLNLLDVENYLSTIEQDAIGEIGNISFGSAATALSSLLNQKVDITTPTVSVINRHELDKEFPIPHVAISVHYTEGFEGMNLLVIKTRDAAVIADLMLGNDGTNVSEDLSEMELSAVQEAMNQMMGSASTSMSTIFNKRVDISPPGIDLLDLKQNPEFDKIPEEDVLIKISFDLKIGNLIDSQIMQLLSVAFAKDMVEQLLNPEQDDHSQPEPTAPVLEMEASREEAAPTVEQAMFSPPSTDNTTRYHEPQHVTSSPRPQDRAVNVQPVAFSSFDAPTLGETEARNLDMLLDIPLEVTVELGRTKRTIKEILELTQGSIVELDKLAGEPVDILVNQRLIAKGEVVVIDENFGVRVTDIVSPKERLNKLK